MVNVTCRPILAAPAQAAVKAVVPKVQRHLVAVAMKGAVNAVENAEVVTGTRVVLTAGADPAAVISAAAVTGQADKIGRAVAARVAVVTGQVETVQVDKAAVTGRADQEKDN